MLPMAAQDLRHHGSQGFRCQRFLQKINGAELHRPNGMRDVTIGSNDHHGGLNSLPTHAFQQLQATDFRHAHIENRQIESPFAHRVERRDSVGRLPDVQPLGFERGPVR